MGFDDIGSTNLFAAPQEFDHGSPMPQGVLDPEIIKKFRQQGMALGVVWIIFGTFALVIAIFMIIGTAALAAQNNPAFPNDPNLVIAMKQIGPFLIALMSLNAILWLLAGIGTLFKKKSAIYLGLIVSYLSLLGNILNLNVCALIILVFVILQTHRVLGWAKQMQAAGVPLDAKPEFYHHPETIR